MVITHEINVKILSSRRQQDLKEPLCPRPDASPSFNTITYIRLHSLTFAR